MSSLLSAIGAHPHLALLAVGLVAFAESVAIIGTLVPAAVVMFTAGAMVGAGSLPLWATLVTAALGAVAGDGLSYELGRRYQERIRAWPPFQRRQASVARGEAFIRRHGGKSIVLARFTGPVRAFVPLLVGFSHMPRRRFYPFNGFSALLWAPAHILPGVIFGTSLQLAEAVSGRLAIIAGLLFALVWFAAWLVSAGIRFGVPLAQRGRDAAVARARGRNTLLARLTLHLLDPNRPGSHALLLGTILLVVAGWLFFGVLQDVLAHDPLVAADLSVFNFLQGLRTPAVDRLFMAVTELGSVWVIFSLVGVVALWLLWRRCWRTASYWLVVAAGGELLILLLKFTLGRQRHGEIYTGIQGFSFPSGHTTLSTVVLGFLTFLLSRRQTLRVRLGLAAFAGVYVVLVAFSRLYLGVHWLSDVLGGISLGVAWSALVAMDYTRRRVEEDFAPGRLRVLAGVLLLFGSLWVGVRSGSDLHRYAFSQPPQLMTAAEWLNGGWERLPAHRRELAGEEAEMFDLQWACSQAALRKTLKAAGWRSPPAWSFASALLWLAPRTPMVDLPVLPRFNQGKDAEVVLVRGSAEGPDAREVLRLWRSGYELKSGQGTGVPIWYSALYRQVRPPGKILHSLMRQSAVPAASMVKSLPGEAQIQLRSGGHDRSRVFLLRCPSSVVGSTVSQ